MPFEKPRIKKMDDELLTEEDLMDGKTKKMGFVRWESCVMGGNPLLIVNDKKVAM
jgi:hypothetical protein